MTRTEYQGQTPFNRQQLKRFIAALDPACRYTQRLASCGKLSAGDHGYVLRCQLAPCPACRSRYATRQRKIARTMLAGATNKDAGMLTIVLGAAADFSDVEAIVAKARWDLRNVVDACRRKDRRWNNVAVLAHLEMDAVATEDMPLLGNERAGLISKLAHGVATEANPIWVPTIHGVVRFDGLDWQEVRQAFGRKWPSERQIHIAGFRTDREISRNGGYITNYSLKHHCINKFGPIKDPWPESWMIEYYSWLAGWTDCLRRTRFKIGRKKSGTLSNERINILDMKGDVAMPLINDSIVLPTLYNC